MTDIDRRHRSAEFGVLIGEAIWRGKGYGAETASPMLDIGFTALGLHSIMPTVDAFNLAGRRRMRRPGSGRSVADRDVMECQPDESHARSPRDAATLHLPGSAIDASDGDGGC